MSQARDLIRQVTQGADPRQALAQLLQEDKEGLGTKWGWERHAGGPAGKFWTATMIKGHHSHMQAFRIGPHPYEKGKWTIDGLPGIGPWETYLDGPFNTPQDAAKAIAKQFEQNHWF